ncbi:RBL19 [Symbiodinium sp. CCMP2592]|nr:RBL19 [Symbiodinium sp. CCMP2592]
MDPPDSGRILDRAPPLSFFERAYEAFEGAPWDVGIPQPALAVALADGEVLGPRILDIGCGTGENAVFLAENGFDVTAFDIVPAAVYQADVFALSEVPEITDLPYDTVLDFAVFHGIGDDEEQRDALRATAASVREGGRLLLHAFSDGNAGYGWTGPRRTTEDHLRKQLAETGWVVRSITARPYTYYDCTRRCCDEMDALFVIAEIPRSIRALCLYLAFASAASSVVVLFWEVVEVFRTDREKDFFLPTRGCCGLTVALALGLRHAYPLEVLPLVPKPWGLQCQHLPFGLVSSCVALGLLGPAWLLPEWPFAPLAFFFAWFHLRYLHWFPHAKAHGDHSPDFVFANLFPQALRPVVSAVGALSHNLASTAAPGLLRIRQPEEDAEKGEAIVYDPSRVQDGGAVLWNSAPGMSLSAATASTPWPAPPAWPVQAGDPLPGAPGSKEYDARRAKALKLLDESISSLLAPQASGPSVEPGAGSTASELANGLREEPKPRRGGARQVFFGGGAGGGVIPEV